ncbi:hypothetical protein L21_2685 [Methanoculleus chikugoensis]|uniref:Uncharacterized protein n=1 Tax=Methanoculleus chikugoensis TaxID=118126 RepID=A0A1M4MPC1_9EURY|nr:hypothetical protein L21_2685 [Methanoculleus chikugoensis]
MMFVVGNHTRQQRPYARIRSHVCPEGVIVMLSGA